MTIFLVNAGLVLLFLYVISRHHEEEVVYDDDYFLQNPLAMEEFQQMPLEFQNAFFRKHKEWIKQKYMDGESYILGYCPNKDVRRVWLSEFLSRKNLGREFT
ncbi:hypothetical protein [Brevibacillus dissolubilis]|uniref:hypothetical protein n=1 Tax=Brevibacillus dissolubilis TaxID=1844116 RepID=UPI001116D132|nr:hypothetical protein [Brevibacillus dissolubilis]